MFWISAKLTAVMLFIVPPISIAAVFYGRFLKKLSRKTQKSVGEMVAVSEERLGAIRTVHAFNGVEPTETKRFKEKVDTIFALAKTEAYASGLFYGGAGFAGNLTMLALLTYGQSYSLPCAMCICSQSSRVQVERWSLDPRSRSGE